MSSEKVKKTKGKFAYRCHGHSNMIGKFAYRCHGHSNMIAGDGCRDLYYLSCENDKAFLGHVIKTFKAPPSRRMDCMHLCYIEENCVSYNLGPENAAEQVCNLSRTDHVEYPDDVKDFPGAKYCPVRNYCAKKPCPSHQTCKPDFDWDTHICLNKKSCAELKKIGVGSGVYNITPVKGLDLEVYCDQDTDGGGWTVIQKRIDGSVDFFRDWDDYKRGFGNKSGEYWLGLKAIHILTNREDNELRVDMETFDEVEKYAVYGMFKVGPASEKYKLALGPYKEGTAGDSFTIHNGMEFSTRDQDNDRFGSVNCAQNFKGAWWFKACHFCHLNGEHLRGPLVTRLSGISWKATTDYKYPVKKAAMKVRPAGFFNA